MSQAPGTAVAAPPQVAPGDALEPVEVGDHHPRGADRELGHPLVHDAGADRGALLVARAAAHGDAHRQPGGVGRRGRELRPPPTGCRREGPGRDRCRRAPGRDRSSRAFSMSSMPLSVSDAGSVTHSSAPRRCRKYFLAVREPARPGEELGLAVAQPGDLRDRPQRRELHAGVRLELVRGDLLAELGLVLEGPAVVPDDRRRDRVLVLVEEDEGAALAREPHRAVGGVRQSDAAPMACLEAAQMPRHTSSTSCSTHPGARRGGRVLLVALTQCGSRSSKIITVQPVVPASMPTNAWVALTTSPHWWFSSEGPERGARGADALLPESRDPIAEPGVPEEPSSARAGRRHPVRMGVDGRASDGTAEIPAARPRVRERPLDLRGWTAAFPGVTVDAVDLHAGLDVRRASHADYAEAVARAAAELPRPLALCGWSMGGLVVLQAAEQVRPDSVVVIEPSAPAEVQGSHPETEVADGSFDPEALYGRPFPAGMRARPESSRARRSASAGSPSQPAVPVARRLRRRVPGRARHAGRGALRIGRARLPRPRPLGRCARRTRPARGRAVARGRRPKPDACARRSGRIRRAASSPSPPVGCGRRGPRTDAARYAATPYRTNSVDFYTQYRYGARP